MIKIAGCLMLVLCSSMLGIIKASTYKARRQELENIIETLKLMEIEITYRKETIYKTFTKLSDMRSGWFSQALKACSIGLEQQLSLQESWKKSIVGYKCNNSLYEDDLDILYDLVMGLGNSDIEGQKKLFISNISRLEINLNKATVAEHKQGKMYTGLGTAAGIVTVILLI